MMRPSPLGTSRAQAGARGSPDEAERPASATPTMGSEWQFKRPACLIAFRYRPLSLLEEPGRALRSQCLPTPDADWNSVDALMLKVLAAAEKVARYRHAQLSAVRLSGDPNARPENVNLEELLESIKAEWVKIEPLIGLELVLGSTTEGGLTVGRRRIERDQRSGA
jgi:hypothetical protein